MSMYRITASGLLAMAAASVSATLLGCVFGTLTPLIAVVSLGVGALLAFLCWRSTSPEPLPAPTLSEWLVVVVFALACLRSFLWVVSWDGDALKVLSRNNLGDLSLHWHYIRYMASGPHFWPENPTLAGVAIRYPIGVDLFNSLLLLCGVPLIKGFIWVGLAGSLFAGAALFRWGRAFAIAGFLFNGGVAGFALLITWRLQDFQAALAWKNLFLSIFVTQRGFLFCLGAGLLLLDSWRTRMAGEKPPLPFWAELLLYGAMPLFHFHTFMFLSVTLAGAVFLAGLRAHAFRLVGAAFFPATWLTLLVTENFSASGVITFKPGWMQEEIPFLEFWFGNFGLWLFLFIVLVAVALQRRDRGLWLFLMPSVAVFASCSLLLFAPWDWDNTKLLIWSYLASLPLIWKFLVQPLAHWLRALVCAAMFFSGAVSLLGGLQERGFHLAQRSESDLLELGLASVPIEATIAVAPDYNHPLIYLGRKLVMGYEGHLFGHGLPYEKVKADLQVLMLGNEGWRDAAGRLGVSYLFWGPREEKAFPGSTKAWQSETVTATPSGTLYKLQDGGN